MRQMKQFVILLSAVLAFSSCVHKVQKEQQEKSIVHTNPLPVKFGDPYVLLASDGIYYMYGTGGGAVDGFSVYSSPDLANWKAEGQVFRGNVPGSWGVANFWAPEVYERGGKFYMLYSADWKENPTNELENFRIGVAVADRTFQGIIRQTFVRSGLSGYRREPDRRRGWTDLSVFFPLLLQTSCGKRNCRKG